MRDDDDVLVEQIYAAHLRASRAETRAEHLSETLRQIYDAMGHPTASFVDIYAAIATILDERWPRREEASK